jgi:hypothetical protein
MADIQTPEELLVHLAARGDPSAFGTLVASRAYSSYISLRNAGKSHTDATAVLVPFFRKIHTAFRRKSEQVPFDEWYRAQTKRHLGGGVNIGEGTEKTPVPDSFPAADISDFESQVRLALQRNYGRMTGRAGAAAAGVISLVNARILLNAVIAAVITLAVAAAGLYGWLSLTHDSLTITVVKSGLRRSIELPADISVLFFRPHTVTNQQNSHVALPGSGTQPADSQPAAQSTAVNTIVPKQPATKIITQGPPAGNPASLKERRRLSAPKKATAPADSLGATGGNPGAPTARGEIKKNPSEPAEPLPTPAAQGGGAASPADTSAAAR